MIPGNSGMKNRHPNQARADRGRLKSKVRGNRLAHRPIKDHPRDHLNQIRVKAVSQTTIAMKRNLLGGEDRVKLIVDDNEFES